MPSGCRLYELRHRAAVGHAELAGLLDLTHGTISKLENSRVDAASVPRSARRRLELAAVFDDEDHWVSIYLGRDDDA